MASYGAAPPLLALTCVEVALRDDGLLGWQDGLPWDHAKVSHRVEHAAQSLLDTLIRPSVSPVCKRHHTRNRHHHKRRSSLGDRSCMALAASLSLPVLTASRAWVELGLPVIMPESLPGKQWMDMVCSSVDRPIAPDLSFRQDRL